MSSNQREPRVAVHRSGWPSGHEGEWLILRYDRPVTGTVRPSADRRLSTSFLKWKGICPDLSILTTHNYLAHYDTWRHESATVFTVVQDDGGSLLAVHSGSSLRLTSAPSSLFGRLLTIYLERWLTQWRRNQALSIEVTCCPRNWHALPSSLILLTTTPEPKKALENEWTLKTLQRQLSTVFLAFSSFWFLFLF